MDSRFRPTGESVDDLPLKSPAWTVLPVQNRIRKTSNFVRRFDAASVDSTLNRMRDCRNGFVARRVRTPSAVMPSFMRGIQHAETVLKLEMAAFTESPVEPGDDGGGRFSAILSS